jgi:hypothetical protein
MLFGGFLWPLMLCVILSSLCRGWPEVFISLALKTMWFT